MTTKNLAIHQLENRSSKYLDRAAVIWSNKTFSYGDLLKKISESLALLQANKITPGSIVSLESDFSPNALAMLIALIKNNSIIAPISSSTTDKTQDFLEIAQIEKRVIIDSQDSIKIESTDNIATHPLTASIKQNNVPGLILFSSGSTGKSKGVVHDLNKLMQKYFNAKKAKNTISFLLFDHIGGFDTIFYTLYSGGTVVTLKKRSPEEVFSAIEKHSVEVLPVSPTFINLMLLSNKYQDYDLSSLEYITYGAELMHECILEKLTQVFPNVKVRQKYGLSELGILRTKSESSNSLWVKIDSDDFKVRVKNGLLEIKANSTMLGYLNEESPFTEDGWFKTGDMVETKGEYIKILGRESEIINVGGRKVYPIEIENIIREIKGVEDVTIKGEENALVGQIVTAKIKLATNTKISNLNSTVRSYLKGKIESYKWPQKIEAVDSIIFNERYKKIRK